MRSFRPDAVYHFEPVVRLLGGLLDQVSARPADTRWQSEVGPQEEATPANGTAATAPASAPGCPATTTKTRQDPNLRSRFRRAACLIDQAKDLTCRFAALRLGRASNLGTYLLWSWSSLSGTMRTFRCPAGEGVTGIVEFE